MQVIPAHNSGRWSTMTLMGWSPRPPSGRACMHARTHTHLAPTHPWLHAPPPPLVHTACPTRAIEALRADEEFQVRGGGDGGGGGQARHGSK